LAASAACGAAPTAAFLVVSRIVQGAAGGVLTPQISATIQQLFQGAQRARAFGYFAFATLHWHGSYASAYRNGVLVTAAITAVALILTLTDRHRAAQVHADQGDHWHHEH
jgi:MFS family permease